ncbi:unnamed protein product, partial [Ectocarpus sp. 6 AP-2014]
MDLEEMFSLPFGVGEKMKDAAGAIPRARQGDNQEYFLPPIARPKVKVLLLDRRRVGHWQRNFINIIIG